MFFAHKYFLECDEDENSTASTATTASTPSTASFASSVFRLLFGFGNSELHR